MTDPAQRSAVEIVQHLRQRTHVGTLANGMTWVSVHDAAGEVASLQIQVRSGSADDPSGATGVAHYLEHLMFRGSANCPDGEFDRQMESLGADINAYTWLDFTAYTTSTRAQHLSAVLELELDRFTAPLWTEDVCITERDVVANERRSEVDTSPDSLLSESLWAAALPNSPYAWPTIGSAEDISAYNRSVAINAFRRNYKAHNICVCVSSCLPHEEVEELLNRTFARIEGEPPSAQSAPGVPAPAAAPRPASPIERHFDMQLHRLQVAWNSPAHSDPRWLAWLLAHEVLAGANSSRLPARFEIHDSLSLDCSASLGAHRLPSIYEFGAILRDGITPEQGLGALDEVLADLAASGPDIEELHAAQLRLVTEAARGVTRSAGRAASLAGAWTTLGNPLAGLQQFEGIFDVTPTLVREVFAQLATGPRVIAIGLGGRS